VLHDAVLERGVEEMVALQVEAAPFNGGLRRALQEFARGVAEELSDVDALDLPLWRGRSSACAGTRGLAVAEEVGEEVVEQTAAATEAARHLFLGEIDLTEVLDFLRAVGTQANSRSDRRSSVTLANGLIDSHLGTSLVAF
jgi:hypothetical protein